MRVPKRPFVFFTEKYNILQLYPNSHSFCTAKYENLHLHSNGNSVFYNKIHCFGICTQTTIRSSHKEIWNLFIINLVSFLKNGEKIKNMLLINSILFSFLQWKAELETLLKLELQFIYKKGYKNIDYRKLVTSL